MKQALFENMLCHSLDAQVKNSQFKASWVYTVTPQIKQMCSYLVDEYNIDYFKLLYYNRYYNNQINVVFKLNGNIY